MAIKVIVLGAAGRTGRQIVAGIMDDPEMELVAAVEAPDSEAVGCDAGELAGIGTAALPVTAENIGDFDVVIDFSSPTGTTHWLAECTRRTKAIVIGTTGHDAVALERVKEAAKLTPVLKAPNMSVGMNLLFRFAEQMGRMLDAAYDVEITETHHRFKVDAPSGSALALRDAVARGRVAAGGAEPKTEFGRHGGDCERARGGIGMHSLRLGDTVGEHTVSFGSLGETITIGHCVHSRETFAAGAIRAAKWIVHQPPGMYTMQDLLFGKTEKA